VADSLRHVDLCSGIGGFALGFQWAGLSRPVLFCDIEDWSRQVLAKHWPDVPIAHDVKELASEPARLVPDCDILSCGYPCQPFSQAGVRRGEEDDRHIWPEIFTIVQAKQPTWCVFENVSGHISLGLDQVLSDLESKGYAVQPFVVPACAVDAPHRRDRVWIIAAHADSGDICRHDQTTQQGGRQQRLAAGCQDVADTASGRSQEHGHGGAEDAVQRGEALADSHSERLEERQSLRSDYAKKQPTTIGDGRWLPEPDVGRVAHGVSRRVDRLKGLGNAIVPQIAMQIGLTIKAVEHG
jgi:DNA (cytosine-5)-methyltransferase 1